MKEISLLFSLIAILTLIAFIYCTLRQQYKLRDVLVKTLNNVLPYTGLTVLLFTFIYFAAALSDPKAISALSYEPKDISSTGLLILFAKSFFYSCLTFFTDCPSVPDVLFWRIPVIIEEFCGILITPILIGGFFAHFYSEYQSKPKEYDSLLIDIGNGYRIGGGYKSVRKKENRVLYKLILRQGKIFQKQISIHATLDTDPYVVELVRNYSESQAIYEEIMNSERKNDGL